MSLSVVARASLVDTTIASLREQVTNGTWSLGDRIPPEPRLAEMLNVSRGTVREAVRVLTHSGMLEVRQGDGTYVRATLDPAETLRQVARAGLHDHLEVRRVLEVECARFAAMRRTPEDLARIDEALARRGDREESLEAFVDRDFAFHQAVADAAHNPALSQLYRWFGDAVRTNILTALTDRALPEPGYDEHHAIVAAIAAGDAEAAVEAARRVIEPVMATLETLLAQEPRP